MKDHNDVTNPAHYDLFPGQYAIDVIQAALTPEEFAGYLKGNCLKYRLRGASGGMTSSNTVSRMGEVPSEQTRGRPIVMCDRAGCIAPSREVSVYCDRHEPDL